MALQLMQAGGYVDASPPCPFLPWQIGAGAAECIQRVIINACTVVMYTTRIMMSDNGATGDIATASGKRSGRTRY